jgi:hypothetical protein
MFVRNLPAIVVVLIVANPVFCQMRGFCEGARSCDCEECRASCTCDGPCEDQEAPTEPYNCPDDSYCQCLRAGAVIKAGPSLDGSQGGFALDRITAVPTLARPALYLMPERFGERLPRGKANPGRIARCLWMSFLC